MTAGRDPATGRRLPPLSEKPLGLALVLDGCGATSVGSTLATLHTGLSALGCDVRSVDALRDVREDELAVRFAVRGDESDRRVAVIEPIDSFCWTEAHIARHGPNQILFGLSKGSCAAIERLGGPQAHYLPLGVDPKVFYREPDAVIPQKVRETANAWGAPDWENTFWFVHVSGMQERKGVEDLLLAYLLEFNAGERVGLLLKKGGSWPHSMTKRIGDAWCEGDAPVAYCDAPLSADEMRQLYSASGAYVSASRMEGWGLPLLEAMACGLQVVATNCIGHEDFLTDENAIRVPCEERTMATALLTDSLTRELADVLRWRRPSLSDLRHALWRAFGEHFDDTEEARIRAGLKTASTYSPQACAEQFVTALDERGVVAKMGPNCPRPFFFEDRGDRCLSTNRLLRLLGKQVAAEGRSVRFAEPSKMRPYHLPIVWGPPTRPTEKGSISFNPVDGWSWSHKRIEDHNRWALVTFGLGKHSTETLRDIGVQRVEPLIVGCDPTVFVPAKTKGPVPRFTEVFQWGPDRENPYRFLTIGAAQPRKNQEQLLRCFCAEFTSKADNVELFVKGGTLWESIDQTVLFGEAAKKNPSASIRLSQSKASDEMMVALYQASDCYVSVAIEEGWGWPGLEASFCGLRVLLSDAPGHCDYGLECGATMIPTKLGRLSDFPEVVADAARTGLTQQVASRIHAASPTDADVRRFLRNAYEAGRVSEQTRQRQNQARKTFSLEAMAKQFLETVDRYQKESNA